MSRKNSYIAHCFVGALVCGLFLATPVFAQQGKTSTAQLMDSREVVVAVQRADVVRLTGIPGIGKKTAERIVLELKDRLTALAPAAAIGVAPASAGDRISTDLLSALQNLGYHRAQVEKAIATVMAKPDVTFEQALRSALRELMR